MLTRLTRVLLCSTVALGIVLPARAYAQATGSIAGVVTDQSGGVMPGVTVDAKNTATGPEGYYSVLLLQPGPYEVKTTLSGFKPVVRQGIHVSVGDTSKVDVKLTVGGLEESVTVTGESPLVETSHATLGITIDQQKVVELPFNARNFTHIGTLIPGVVAP